MDALKLNMVAIDHLHPLLGELARSLLPLPIQFAGKEKIRDWLIELNSMKASDELSPEQVRQLLFDLERAHSSFYASLSEMK